MPTLNGSLEDWPADSRLDTPVTGAPGYGLYGTTDPDYFWFAIESDDTAVGANTTLWLDTDLDRTTGYQIWGWTGGVEYYVEVGGDGVPRLYSTEGGGTYIADVEYAQSADGKILEFRILRSDIGNPEMVRVFSDVNDTAFIPSSYGDTNFLVGDSPPALTLGGKILDGDLSEWDAENRLDTPETGVANYAIYGDLQDGVYTFAISTDGVAIGANTTIWLDTDRDTSTGYLLWGWAAGAEYNINFGQDGVARLYSGAAGEILIAEISYALSSDGTVAELAVDAATIGSPDAVRIFADVNDSVYIPNSYSTANFIVGDVATPSVTTGGKTLDGDLIEWDASKRLDTAETGVANYAMYGDLQDGVYTFAISTDGVAIGANTTIWLDSDLDTSTGYQVWGWAAGAEYNINFGQDGIARLYSGAAGAVLIAEIAYAISSDGTIAELAVDASAIGSPSAIRIFADVNDSVFIPNNYAQAEFVVGDQSSPQVGTKVIDGLIGASEWSAAELLYTTPGDAGYSLSGSLEENSEFGDQFVLSIGSDLDAIGSGTTIWLDTDLESSTGYLIWGWAGGAEYNINISSDGAARLYTGAAGESFVANLQFGRAANGSGFEVALPKSLLAGSPNAIRILADINNSVFLPESYAGANLVVQADVPDVPQTDDPGLRIAIVYSETTAENYYNITNYGQLFMSAQNQATQAGIPYDLLNEDDLLDPAGLAQYDAIVFPGFSHVRGDQVDAIAASLETAVARYGIGLIAAGNFLTNDEFGAALSGNAYARMSSLLGVTLEGFGSTQGVDLITSGGAHPVLDSYSSGQVVGEYSNISYLHFTDTTGSGTVLFEQQVTDGSGGVAVHDGVIATETQGRNVHFASDALLGNNNILGEALDWVAKDNSPDVSLLMTRGSSLFYSRNDMDQAQEAWDVIDQNPGIYDAMLPIIEDWYAQYGFVGSYYIDIGAYEPDQRTDWSVSKPYFDRILALESEIGSHSYTHPSDTNLLLPDTVTQELIDQRALAYSDIVDHGYVCWCPYCMREDASDTVLRALSKMNASEINAMLADTLSRTDPRNPNSIDPADLTEVELAVLEASYRFQFEYSKLVIEREMGITVTGAAVPGAPEQVDATREIIKYYDYLSGGYSGVGAGFPGAFGYLTPDETEKVYLAPNMSFDFSLIGFKGMTPEQATAVWLEEYDSITSNATTPIIAFPWHDYGPTNWDLGEPGQVYTRQMFDTLIGRAAADGTEFVTGEDLAQRIESFAASSVTTSRTGDVVTATVTSSDAGHFRLDMGSEGTIASAANWYAYNSDSVFLPRAGGTFKVSLGQTPANATHINELGQRNDLISVSGDKVDLAFSFEGRSDVYIDTKDDLPYRAAITGAQDASFASDGDLVLGFAEFGVHTVTLDLSTGTSDLAGSAEDDILIASRGGDRLAGNAGNDLLIGLGGGDAFIFEQSGGVDEVRGFTSGVDVLEFSGLGFTDSADALSRFENVSGGVRLAFDATSSLMLSGLQVSDLSVNDIIVTDPFAVV